MRLGQALKFAGYRGAGGAGQGDGLGPLAGRAGRDDPRPGEELLRRARATGSRSSRRRRRAWPSSASPRTRGCSSGPWWTRAICAAGIAAIALILGPDATARGRGVVSRLPLAASAPPPASSRCFRSAVLAVAPPRHPLARPPLPARRAAPCRARHGPGRSGSTRWDGRSRFRGGRIEPRRRAGRRPAAGRCLVEDLDVGRYPASPGSDLEGAADGPALPEPRARARMVTSRPHDADLDVVDAVAQRVVDLAFDPPLQRRLGRGVGARLDRDRRPVVVAPRPAGGGRRGGTARGSPARAVRRGGRRTRRRCVGRRGPRRAARPWTRAPIRAGGAGPAGREGRASRTPASAAAAGTRRRPGGTRGRGPTRRRHVVGGIRRPRARAEAAACSGHGPVPVRSTPGITSIGRFSSGAAAVGGGAGRSRTVGLGVAAATVRRGTSDGPKGAGAPHPRISDDRSRPQEQHSQRSTHHFPPHAPVPRRGSPSQSAIASLPFFFGEVHRSKIQCYLDAAGVVLGGIRGVVRRPRGDGDGF